MTDDELRKLAAQAEGLLLISDPKGTSLQVGIELEEEQEAMLKREFPDKMKIIYAD